MASITLNFDKWIDGEQDLTEWMPDEEDDYYDEEDEEQCEENERHYDAGFYSSDELFGHIDYGWGVIVTEQMAERGVGRWVNHIVGSFKTNEDGSVEFILGNPDDPKTFKYGEGTAESIEQMIELIKQTIKSNELTKDLEFNFEIDEEYGELGFDLIGY